MKTIFKYPVKTTDTQKIEGRITKLLTVQVQRGIACIWGEVDTELEKEGAFEISIIGTGNPMPEDPGEYLGSYQLHNGELIFHVYWKKVD